MEGFSIYPNPVSNNVFTISSASSLEKQVKLYNTVGTLVLDKIVSNKQRINVSHLNAGIYILRVIENNKTATRKLVIK
ncbi:hypothetical protein BWZ22_15565 [Seonamhaeicola sp. S2-3]|nr:hypothetical protein BWZ22_15565 [Seonamhaeicola sp. S2-3]